jgi:alpha-ketoglutarate-dependent taurine dioxygenase
MDQCRIDPIPATLGAVVTGVRLASLSDREWEAIEAAFHEHALLVFPDQHLDADEQVAFGLRFGELEHIIGDTGIVAISNQRPDGSLLEEDNAVMQIMIGNEGWHTDSSYMPLAAKASMLSAQVVPPSGGQTAWADMRAAYQALDEETRERIAVLSAKHSLKYSQARIGHTDPGEVSYGFQDGDPPLRPLVKIHPITGRPSLFIGRHAFGIPGLSSEESEQLLQELLDFACQAPRTYEHDWQPGDIAVWDNRCLLHRARPYDHSEPRVMKHTRIAGEQATEWAPSLPESG